MRTELLYNVFQESAGISTDTRTIRKGDLFFALSGSNFNGNKFVQEALAKGAIAAVIDDPAFEGEKTILVKDCLKELQALASMHREKLNAPVLAVTGTNGKTTTKELLAAVLSGKYNVHYTKGNLNNHIGVPLTILSAPAGTGFMIIEMGANHPGEIRELCSVTMPDYGIITNVGTAHLEGFGSFEGVIRTKCELYEYLALSGGTAIYNDQNPILADKVKTIVKKSIAYSYPLNNELMVEAVSPVPLIIRADYMGTSYSLKTNLFGSHNLENVKAAIATGLMMGVGMGAIVDSISSYMPSNNRSEIRRTKTNTLICDSYNANPTSMSLAIKSFNEITDKKKALILGDMLELGEKSDEEHRKILDLIGHSGDQEVFLVGPRFMKIAADRGFKAFSATAGLIEYLRNNPIEGRTVLIKGSRGIALEKVYDLL